jgi:hypothetical protein
MGATGERAEMNNAIEAISELSPDRRQFHLDLRDFSEEIEPRVQAFANKHRCALLVMHVMRDSPDVGPVWDAAMKAESGTLKEFVETRCGSHAVFIQKLRYLTLYISILDPDVEEIHAVTDAVHAYLLELDNPAPVAFAP